MTSPTGRQLPDFADDDYYAVVFARQKTACYFDKPSRHGACDECGDGEIVDLGEDGYGFPRICASYRNAKADVLNQFARSFLLRSVAEKLDRRLDR